MWTDCSAERFAQTPVWQRIASNTDDAGVDAKGRPLIWDYTYVDSLGRAVSRMRFNRKGKCKFQVFVRDPDKADPEDPEPATWKDSDD